MNETTQINEILTAMFHLAHPVQDNINAKKWQTSKDHTHYFSTTFCKIEEAYLTFFQNNNRSSSLLYVTYNKDLYKVCLSPYYVFPFEWQIKLLALEEEVFEEYRKKFPILSSVRDKTTL